MEGLHHLHCFHSLAASHWQVAPKNTTPKFRLLTIAVYFLYPETRGLSLEQIDTLFMKDEASTQAFNDMRRDGQIEVKPATFSHVDQVDNA